MLMKKVNIILIFFFLVKIKSQNLKTWSQYLNSFSDLTHDFKDEIKTLLQNDKLNKHFLSNKKAVLLKSKYLKNKVMAHRGLYGYFPEHSIKAFEIAYFMGADYLETDINLTKDGKMIVFHDPILDEVTNVAKYPEYNNRRRNKTVDGIYYENKLFVSDFTYDEISNLYIAQRFPKRPQIYNNEFKVLLIEDLIRKVILLNEQYNKKTGIYIEPKNPSHYFEELNIDINLQIYQLLDSFNLTNIETKSFYYEKCPIVIQAFELDTLRYFREKTNLPQIYLMAWRFFYNIHAALDYADGLGPNINFIIYERLDDLLIANNTHYKNEEEFIKNVVNKTFADDVEALGKRLLNSKSNLFLEYAKKLNLHVHPYDMNNDNPKFSLDPEIQYCKIHSLGADGFFADFCDTALFSMKYSDKLCKDYSISLKNKF